MAATHHAPNEIDVGIARVVDVLEINKPGIKTFKDEGRKEQQFCRLPGSGGLVTLCACRWD